MSPNVPLDQHILVPHGPEATHIVDLWWFYTSVMIVVCIGVWTCILIALMRRGQGVADPSLDAEVLSQLPPPARALRSLPTASEKRRTRWVVGATVLTVLTLFVLLVRSVGVSALLAQLPDERPLRIEVTGHRWWWELRYIEDDVSQTFSSANELHIPVRRPIELKLRSADVIHSFWVPNLHGKRDLIPGRDSVLRFQADEQGTYRGQCAEFCGTSHARMALRIQVESAAAFQAWKGAQRALPSAPASAEAQRGKDLFLSGPCAMCHTVAGTSAQSSAGPDLTHVASRHSLAAETLANTRGHLAGWLSNAPNLKPGTTMPSMSFEAEQLHALIAYLEGLR